MKVLKFGAVWCPGCLVMRPRWEQIEKENPWLETQYFDFDNDKKAVSKYDISDKLPTFVFLDKSSNEFLRLNGEIDKNKLVDIINENKDK
jgi:thiol-disulfide isomerase/thioredoxin